MIIIFQSCRHFSTWEFSWPSLLSSPIRAAGWESPRVLVIFDDFRSDDDFTFVSLLVLVFKKSVCVISCIHSSKVKLTSSWSCLIQLLFVSRNFLKQRKLLWDYLGPVGREGSTAEYETKWLVICFIAACVMWTSTLQNHTGNIKALPPGCDAFEV